jgi:pimeloyl-ACP methyl ester carboxylesterase
MARDIAARGRHRFYFRDGTLDFYAGWLLGYSQVGGASPGAVYHALNQVRPRRPQSWVDAFTDLLSAHEQLAVAASAARAALNLAEAGSLAESSLIDRMEQSFQAALRAQQRQVESWEIPFGKRSLPSYVSRQLGERPLVVVVGGGDTYREDLWFFGGSAAYERGYSVLLPDLPGQGSTPLRGLHFGPQTLDALVAVIDAVRERGHTGPTILLGWSGGGLFTAKYVELVGGVNAWVASTPISDMARALELGLPALLRRPPDGALQRFVLRLAGRLDPVRAATVAKYERQFGPGGIPEILRLLRSIGEVDLARLNIPLLALVGASEDAEFRRQAVQIYEAVRRRRPESRLIEFTPITGSDSHCQVNNLPLAFAHIFSWLTEIGLPSPAPAHRSPG